MSYQQEGTYQQAQRYPHTQGYAESLTDHHAVTNNTTAGAQNCAPNKIASPPLAYQPNSRAVGPETITPIHQSRSLRSYPLYAQPQSPQNLHSMSHKDMAEASVYSAPTNFSDTNFSDTNFSQNIKPFDPEYGRVAAPENKPHGSYFRQHPVTSPWFYWLDNFEPDVRRRWTKAPKRVKLGTTTTKDASQRRHYAIRKLLGREKKEGPGHRQKDYFGRIQNRQKDDRYISTWDGRLKELVVMTTDDVFYGTNDATWTRTRIITQAPFALRVTGWCAWPVLPPNLSTSHKLLRRFVGGLLLFFPNIPADQFFAHGKHNGEYEPLLYTLHGYAKISRNEMEAPDRWDARNGHIVVPAKPRVILRTMGPARLCKITWPEDILEAEEEDEKLQQASVQIIQTDNWDVSQTGEPFPEYVFIAYIQKQFPQENEADLHNLALKAARDAGVNHYWIACSCMESSDEIYHISDIVRTSKAVAIAINTNLGVDSVTLLRQFGDRVWVLPELLLAPQADNIFHVYSQRGSMFFTRFQIVRSIWSDSETSRQLVDHFQGSLELSRLELSVIALKSFYSRERGFKYPGDREYALMGLLRQRVTPNPEYSEFEAFASLSLLADNDQLLERLICLQPRSRAQKWNDMDDAYGASLWDIYPTVQVSGIGHGGAGSPGNSAIQQYDTALKDTVIIDGLKAAKVRWKSFAPVCTVKRKTFMRLLIDIILRWSSIMFIIGIALMAMAVTVSAASGGYGGYSGYSRRGYTTYYSGSSYAASSVDPTYILVGLLFFLPGLFCTLFTPELLLKRSGGKIWGNQPWLFGIEGYCNIGEIEAAIFGINLGHLKWSAFGSPLSRHEPNQYGDVCGTDPMTYPDVREHVEHLRHTKEARVFMLVDTGMMTVTLFESARPPIAFMLAASEGGMQRAIGVSYDWTTNTMYRECVLRFDTTTEDRMWRVQRVRMGLRRSD